MPAGATTAILTASETPYDAWCDLRSVDPVEQVLPAVFGTSSFFAQPANVPEADDGGQPRNRAFNLELRPRSLNEPSTLRCAHTIGGTDNRNGDASDDIDQDEIEAIKRSVGTD